MYAKLISNAVLRLQLHHLLNIVHDPQAQLCPPTCLLLFEVAGTGTGSGAVLFNKSLLSGVMALAERKEFQAILHAQYIQNVKPL